LVHRNYFQKNFIDLLTYIRISAYDHHVDNSSKRIHSGLCNYAEYGRKMLMWREVARTGIADLFRDNRGTQAQWAESLGMSRQHLSDVASGRRDLTMDLAERILTQALAKGGK
jgi:hypothetical protein